MTTENYTERRIHYRYGVNSGTRTGRRSFEDLQRDLERDTQGPVDVVRREHREVFIETTEWESPGIETGESNG